MVQKYLFLCIINVGFKFHNNRTKDEKLEFEGGIRTRDTPKLEPYMKYFCENIYVFFVLHI